MFLYSSKRTNFDATIDHFLLIRLHFVLASPGAEGRAASPGPPVRSAPGKGIGCCVGPTGVSVDSIQSGGGLQGHGHVGATTQRRRYFFSFFPSRCTASNYPFDVIAVPGTNIVSNGRVPRTIPRRRVAVGVGAKTGRRSRCLGVEERGGPIDTAKVILSGFLLYSAQAGLFEESAVFVGRFEGFGPGRAKGPGTCSRH